MQSAVATRKNTKEHRLVENPSQPAATVHGRTFRIWVIRIVPEEAAGHGRPSHTQQITQRKWAQRAVQFPVRRIQLLPRTAADSRHSAFAAYYRRSLPAAFSRRRLLSSRAVPAVKKQASNGGRKCTGLTRACQIPSEATDASPWPGWARAAEPLHNRTTERTTLRHIRDHSTFC